jgi:hypothetical protein
MLGISGVTPPTPYAFMVRAGETLPFFIFQSKEAIAFFMISVI